MEREDKEDGTEDKSATSCNGEKPELKLEEDELNKQSSNSCFMEKFFHALVASY